MRIAVAATGKELGSALDARFGRAPCFVVVDTETGQFEAFDNAQNVEAAQGAGIQAAQNVAKLDVQALIARNVGPKAYATLISAQIKIFLSEGGTVQEAVDFYKAGKLQETTSANVAGHWV